jgi:hypothetical protein
MGRDEPIARELHQRFGDLIEIEVAGRPYPFVDSADPPPRVAHRIANATEHGIGARTVLDEPFRSPFESGHIVTGHVEIHNLAGDRIDWHVEGNKLDGDVCDAHGAVVGLRNAIGRDTGGHLGLDPDQLRDMPFYASTDSRDRRLGPVLPAGSYQLFVVIRAATSMRDQPFDIVCPPVPIELT